MRVGKLSSNSILSARNLVQGAETIGNAIEENNYMLTEIIKVLQILDCRYLT